MNHTALSVCKPPAFQRGLLATLILLGIVSFVNSARDAYNYGGIDLRNRIVGARAIWSGIDPYTLDWQSGMSQRLLDPWRRSPGLTRVTVPPTTLFAYGAVSWMPYRAVRWVAFGLEWAALIASITILVHTLQSRADRLLLANLAILFFVCGSFWRLHVERGQFYVWVTLLISLGILLELRPACWRTCSGIPFGLAVILRPSFVVMLPILWLARRRHTAAVAVATTVTSIAITTFTFGADVWISYCASMKEYGKARADESYELRKYGPAKSLPEVAEGVNFGRMMDGHTEDVTITNALNVLAKHTNFDLSAHAAAASKVMAFVSFFLIALTCYRAEEKQIGLRSGLALAVAAALNLEFCVPIRHGYTDVMYLPMLALIIPLLRSSRTPTIIVFGVLFAFSSGHLGRFLNPVLNGARGTVLRSCLFMATTTLALLIPRIRGILDRTCDEARS